MAKFEEILFSALKAKYQADFKEAEANLAVYRHNATGVGEHSEIVAEMDKQVEKMACAKEKLSILKDIIGS